ncbi:uncharacterized protein N7503_008474 [Penicillium pulvis]|uniref:uncharacterized protein n=1 Tax=Penicillium pulvis TaxID=1562058 RepID=UPI0025488806|nr:uncharacterized protein N7503_008474 [Penicillium pulvis]KAJ5792496.1 hypothetical protein N7503_008474 [Penicillium pulvis]
MAVWGDVQLAICATFYDMNKRYKRQDTTQNNTQNKTTTDKPTTGSDITITNETNKKCNHNEYKLTMKSDPKQNSSPP